MVLARPSTCGESMGRDGVGVGAWEDSSIKGEGQGIDTGATSCGSITATVACMASSVDMTLPWVLGLGLGTDNFGSTLFSGLNSSWQMGERAQNIFLRAERLSGTGVCSATGIWRGNCRIKV